MTNQYPPPSPHQNSMGYQRPIQPQKDSGVAYLWMILTFFGIAGAQHFYLRKPLRGVIWILTWGLFGIGTLVDIFTINAQTRKVNWEIGQGIR